MKKLLIGASLLLVVAGAATAAAVAASRAELIEQGRYVVTISGCNDCHTAGFASNAGKVPESQWLLGDTLGWSGPWGTTYAPNLRLRLASMDLPTFKTYARTLTARPPMPYWAVNAMTDRDLEALYAYVQSLGPAGEHAPPALAPGQEPSGPVVRFPGPPPEAAAAH